MQLLTEIIIVLGIVNLLRLALFMISADIYDIKKALNRRQSPLVKPYRPFVTVVIPAYNEEMGVIRTIESVLANAYPYKQVVVVDDGSIDKTWSMLKKFAKQTKSKQLKIIHQKNGGKATAINNALQNHSRGSLVMVLDADSLIHPEAIQRMVKHFEDPSIVAAAANVKVLDGYSLLNIAQRLEYVISYRMKRALTVLNMEYIIGGVGSTFRRSIIKSCGYYDDDTQTEDIDFTMKIINKKGNAQHHIIFASDVLTYTEGVLTFRGLLKQRLRWKYGRMQAFVKNRDIFFSRDAKHTRQLAWAYLPFIVFSEIILLFEPLFTGFVIYASFKFGGTASFASVYLFVTLFSLVNVLAESSESWRARLKLLALIPIAYPLLTVMSTVDFLVLIRALTKFPDIIRGRNQVSNWQHVERSGVAANVQLS